MDIGNVAQLKVLNAPKLQLRNRTQGQEKDVEFLSLRLLNKRGRVRLSPEPIEYNRKPGKSCLLAVGNLKGYLAVAVRKDGGNHILLATLNELRAIFESGHPDPEPFITFTPRQPLIPMPGTPAIIKFVLNDERLIIGFLEGPILVYNTNDFFTSAGIQPSAIYTFPGDASTIPRDILPNPGESPELVAVMRGVHGQEPGHQVDIIDVQQLKHVTGWRKGNDPTLVPVSMSWSPKGKQIAIGLQSGDMLLYSPLSPATPKSQLLRPPSLPTATSSLLATTWLTNPTFYTIFSSPEASSSSFDGSMSASLTKTHIISTHDSKSQSVVDVELQDPSPPFGAQIPPGPFAIVLRNWSPSKFIIICGDGPSPDIGIIGSLSTSPDGGQDAWVNFILEETSTPSLPLGEDAQDMALLGMEIDLTSSRPVRISEQPDDGIPDLPPSPILYAYMSDGTIIAWHVLNTTGKAYPGMITAMDSTVVAPAIAPPVAQPKADVQAIEMLSVSPAQSPIPEFPRPAKEAPASTQPALPFGKVTTSLAQGFGAFASTNATTDVGSAGFGFGTGTAASGFGKPSAPATFGAPSFGAGDGIQKPPVSSFGSTGFGQTSTTPTFGAPSFGAKAAPAFGQPAFGAFASSTTKMSLGSSTGGFASFASQGTSSFGSPVSTSESKPAQVSLFGQVTSPAAPAPQSAFGPGGSGQAALPTTSAFGAGGSGSATPFGQQPAIQQPVSAFGNLGPKTPVFGKAGFGDSTASSSQSGGFAGFRALGDSLSQRMPPVPEIFGSPPDSPPAPPRSLDGSPPGSPKQRPTTESTKPTSSYVKPAEGFGTVLKQYGAFAVPNVATPPVSQPAGSPESSSQHKPTAAFGQSKPAVPAFGASSFGTPPPASVSTVTPTFGSTSVLGKGKPLFGTSSFGTTPQSTFGEPTKQIAGGFGAFSSGGAGSFASFAAASKSTSFDDILSSGGPEKPKPTEVPLVFGTPGTKISNAPALGAPTERKPSPTPISERPTGMLSIRGAGVKMADSKEEGGTSKKLEGSIANQGSTSMLNKEQDASFSLLSLSEATPELGPTVAPKTSSVPSVKEAEDAATRDGEECVDTSEDAEESTSEPFSLTDDGLEDSLPDSEPSPGSSEPLPAAADKELNEAREIPLPETPTPRSSPTPTQVTSKLPAVDVLPPPKSLQSDLTGDSVRASTTPPGSPEKPIPSLLAPKPAVPSPSVLPFHLGLGRPSSRPIRSSPLATAPIINPDDEDHAPDDTPSKSAPPAVIGLKPTEATRPFGPLFPSGQSSLAGSFADSITTFTLHRPKTPPSMGKPLTPPGFSPAPFGTPVVSGQSQVSPASLNPPGLFGPPLVATPVIPMPVPPVSQAKQAEAVEPPQNPMQIEFQRAYQDIMNELTRLNKKAQELSLIRSVISEPRGLNKLVLNNEEFVPGKYSHGDLSFFTSMLGTLQKKVAPLLEQGDAHRKLLQDLHNLGLISETKLEELSSWVRAREDPEFAKTLKPRTLGPEHSENQMRLRKAIHTARDRIQRCEDEIEALKKRLEQHKSGKIGMRPPSLDTIDRTCRNIQLALEERMKLLEEIEVRIDALSPQTSQRLRSSHILSTASFTRPGSVTPPFASVAAAALNSERSSLTLKNALLSGRKEPLLTTRVVRPDNTGTPSPRAQTFPQPRRPEWKLPPVPPLTTSPSPGSVTRRGTSKGKRHGAVQLKTGTQGSNAKPVAFDWGPLPGVAPMDKLTLDMRSQNGRATNMAKQGIDDQ